MVVPSFRIYLGRPTRPTKMGERCVYVPKEEIKRYTAACQHCLGEEGARKQCRINFASCPIN